MLKKCKIYILRKKRKKLRKSVDTMAKVLYNGPVPRNGDTGKRAAETGMTRRAAPVADCTTLYRATAT